MLRLIFACFSISLITFSSLAQEGPVLIEYLDKDWKETDSAAAKFERAFLFEDREKQRALVLTTKLPKTLLNKYWVNFPSPDKYILDGQFISYYDDGKIKAELEYRNDSLDGKVKTYYADGQLRRDDWFRKGELVSGQCYSTTGQDTAYFLYERPATYPGGYQELYRQVAARIKYPEKSIKANEQGRVIVGFIIEKDGSVSNIQVVQSVSELIDKEAIRVVASLDKFIPAEQEGYKVRYRFKLPVKFSLQ